MDIFFHISTNGLKPLTINKTCVGKSKTKIPHKIAIRLKALDSQQHMRGKN